MSTPTSSLTRKTNILTPLFLRPLVGRQWMVYGLYDTAPVISDFLVMTDAAGLITIPAGFICDLNSVPRCLWWASTPTDHPEAGAVHDWAYRGNLTRSVADRVYAEILTYQGMADVRVASRYTALRTFGWMAYGRKKP